MSSFPSTAALYLSLSESRSRLLAAAAEDRPVWLRHSPRTMSPLGANTGFSPHRNGNAECFYFRHQKRERVGACKFVSQNSIWIIKLLTYFDTKFKYLVSLLSKYFYWHVKTSYLGSPPPDLLWISFKAIENIPSLRSLNSYKESRGRSQARSRIRNQEVYQKLEAFKFAFHYVC